ncbi:MAG TPA: ATP-binding protein [Smithellaceae bacterium]|nr:ATP-binding protein [Smithellaceae bacterium]HQM45551.1 ATP-binding protein [Smithellaceae bacterium]
MKRSLFFKIFFSYLVVIAFSFIVLSTFIKNEIQQVMTGQIVEELQTYAGLIDLSKTQFGLEQVRHIAYLSGSRVTLADVRGRVFADSEKDIAGLDNHLNRPEIQEARVRGKGKSVRFSQTLGVNMLYVAVTLHDKDQITGYVRLARPLHNVQNVIDQVYQTVFLTILIISIFSLILAILVSYQLAKPIRAMEQFTRKLRQGDLQGSILLNTSDETKTLADNINYLVEELQSKIRLANEEKSKLMTALTSIDEGVLIVNTHESIEMVSPSLIHILKEPYGKIAGKTLMEAFRNADLQRLFLKFRQSQETATGEITLGGLHPVILQVSISEIHGYPDEEKFMVVFHNVTRLKKLEQIRTDFIANVSHEIRTPLTAIIGYLETLQNGALESAEDARRFIDVMLRQAQRLHRLVEDLLTISKIELGEMEFHFEPILLSETVDHVISLLEAKAKEKKISMQNDLTRNLPPVKADRDRLCQILVNVLDNAVKFTGSGGRVTIDAEVQDNFVVLRIFDTGMGIPKEELQRLGERFYRVDKARSRELGGTGLGLSIVKHLMLVHGGKMEIDSRLGRGTSVSLFFPVSTMESSGQNGKKGNRI